ncbi:tail fiber domain-containing protein [Mesorhizobium sp. KR9-304]|uniref:tail fiber domain-containing protein n=1 Tax=Mesorhizobium sp. KR9-304 TaxID=3156614 RepID=UPI0032B35541
MRKTYVKPAISKRGVLSAVTAGGDSFVLMKPSDRRLKTDIERVGAAANGLPIYNFKYIGGDEVYRGVMAQDVLAVLPEAVSIMPNGFLAVRYDMLGLEMTRVY